MTNIRKALLLSLCMAGASLLVPAIASAAVDIIVAPPAPRVEVVPRRGRATSGRLGIGRGAAMSMSGFRGDGFPSAMAITGSRIGGSSAATTGITTTAIGRGKTRYASA